MEPTLHCAYPEPGCEGDAKDLVLAEAVDADDLRRGDIVAFETPTLALQRCGAGGAFAKRLIGLPGERVELRNEGGSSYVYINGKKLDEPYIEPDRRDTRGAETYNIPQGQYILMGDNRIQSCDSREWGTVPAENIHHRVVAVERSSVE